VRRHRGNRILAAWYADPDYTNPDGEPKALEIKTTRRRAVSFWSLVKRYAPGVWPRLILDELLRVGAVEEIADEKLRVKMQSYGTAGLEIEAIEDLGDRARDLLETLVHNLQNPSSLRVCETVLTLDADPKWLPVLRNSARRRTKAFLSGLSEEINSPRTSRAAPSDPGARIGITVYSFENPAPEGPDDARKKSKRSR